MAKLHFLSFSSSPSDLACVGCTSAQMDLYLSAATGNDANDGLTTATAVATPERIDELIPATIDHPVLVHVAAGTYTLTRPYIFRERNRRAGYIRVIADEVWDPTVFNVDLTGVAAAGTNDSRCVTAGLVANDWRGAWLRFTDGDAAGQWRTIQGNTVTDLVPCDIWGYYSGLVPAPGDTFQVCSPAVVFELPFETSSLTAGNFGSSIYMGDFSPYRFACWQWEGIGFDAEFLTIPAMHFLVGAWNFANNTSVGGGLVGFGAVIGGVAPYGDNDLGHQWGLTCDSALYSPVPGGWFYGTLVADAVRASGYWTGGHITQLEVGYAIGTAPPLASFEIAYFPFITQTLETADVFNGATLLMGWADFIDNAGILLRVANGGLCIIDHAAEVTGESTGATTCLVVRNGRVFLDEAPALGKAVGLDWQNDDGIGVNKAAFVVNFSHQFRLNTQERA